MTLQEATTQVQELVPQNGFVLEDMTYSQLIAEIDQIIPTLQFAVHWFSALRYLLGNSEDALENKVDREMATNIFMSVVVLTPMLDKLSRLIQEREGA